MGMHSDRTQPVADSPVNLPPSPAAADAAPVVTTPSRAWNDVPLRTKVLLMVMLALMCGALLGMIEARLGRPGWVLAVGFVAVMVGMSQLGRHWVWLPFERLVQELGRLSKDPSPQHIKRLPSDRKDEVGQLARAIQEQVAWSLRVNYDSRQLRRTLDHRIVEATQKATRELRNMAHRDALTGLANRRFMDEHVDGLFESVKVSGEDLVCVLIDVDNFKQVNDTLGHAAGDEILTFLASLIRGSIRAEDYAIRLGGDEFVLYMPGSTPQRAAEFARQLAGLFQQHARKLPTAVQPSLSIGIASQRRDHATHAKQLLEIADENVYAAKEAGKNSVVGG